MLMSSVFLRSTWDRGSDAFSFGVRGDVDDHREAGKDAAARDAGVHVEGQDGPEDVEAGLGGAQDDAPPRAEGPVGRNLRVAESARARSVAKERAREGRTAGRRGARRGLSRRSRGRRSGPCPGARPPRSSASRNSGSAGPRGSSSRSSARRASAAPGGRRRSRRGGRRRGSRCSLRRSDAAMRNKGKKGARGSRAPGASLQVSVDA